MGALCAAGDILRLIRILCAKSTFPSTFRSARRPSASHRAVSSQPAIRLRKTLQEGNWRMWVNDHNINCSWQLIRRNVYGEERPGNVHYERTPPERGPNGARRRRGLQEMDEWKVGRIRNQKKWMRWMTTMLEGKNFRANGIQQSSHGYLGLIQSTIR